MKSDIILCGVGGQGILSIATVIGEAALIDNLYLKQSEVHGMSQRGGEVQSHLRLSSDPIASDLIPQGEADLIISLEPMEALRYLPYLKKDGYVITNSVPFVNIPNYPDKETLMKALEALPKKVIIDAEDYVMRTLKNSKVANMLMLGIACYYIGFSPRVLEQAIHNIFSKKGEEVVDLNIRALDLGVLKSASYVED